MLETNMWKSANSNQQDIRYDAGAGNSETADYLIIFGHNLFTVDADVYLQYSDTGAYGGEEVSVISAYTVLSDDALLIEFTKSAAWRYWRLLLATMTGTPFITLAIWGNKTELDYASASLDPHSMTARASVNITQGGYMAGTHTKHIERSLALRFTDADSTLYNKVKAWWDTSGLKNFFVAWETANSPSDVYLMRPDTRFNNPLINGGSYRDISISLKGRKE
jgi:hypothetical protein